MSQMGGNCRCANGDSILALVTESHFFGYDSITGIRILVAVIAFSAGVTSAYAPGSRITDLRTVAEQSIIAVRVNRAIGLRLAYSVRRVTLLTGGTLHRREDTTAYRVTAVSSAQVPIVTIQRCTGLAAGYRVTCFKAIAENPIITVFIQRLVYYITGVKIAIIKGTANTVIHNDRGIYDHSIDTFISGTEVSIVDIGRVIINESVAVIVQCVTDLW